MLRWASSVLALALALLLAPGVGAFASLPGGPHDAITDAAAREAGYPEAGIEALVQSVRNVDLRDNLLEAKASDLDRIDAAAPYRPEHHCDRAPPASDESAFAAAVAYIHDRSQAAVAAAHANDTDAAVHALGELLHAVQDCFSHSNAVDLDDSSVMVQAVNGHAPPPGGLRLTGFQVGAEDPEDPSGDAYSHAHYAKDSADKNNESGMVMPDGRSKFEAARDLAIQASIVALQDVLVELEPYHLEAFAATEAGGQPIPRVGIPGSPAILVAIVLVASVTLRRRTP